MAENTYKLSVGESRQQNISTTRKKQFWDIFKSQFSNLMKMELLVLVLSLPMLALIIYFFPVMDAGVASGYNFSGRLLFGYPGTNHSLVTAQIEMINLNFMKAVFLVPGITLMGPALAGLFYTLRQYVWGENVRIRTDFWRGLKLGWIQTTIIMFLFSLILMVCVWNINYFSIQLILSEVDFWGIMALISAIILLFISVATLITALPVVSMYKMKLTKILKNSFLLSLAALPTTLLILFFTAIPFLFAMLIPAISMLIYMFFFFIGIVFFTLMWTVYTQHLMDRFFKAEKNAAYGKGIAVPAVLTESIEEAGEKKEEVKKFKKVNVYSNPKKKKNVSITPLSENYSRADLERLQKEKDELG